MSNNKMATKADLQELYQRILPYLGGMPEVLANKFSKGDMYSADEKMIGQWIDGKPLYQKVITKTISKTVGTWVDLESLPNSNVVKFEGYAVGDGQYYPVPYTSGGAVYLSFRYESGKIQYITGDSNWMNNNTLYLTIQYTKTTDSAVSIGNDTDYSTDEKIIGTWIDGKPLYQKTVDLGSQQILTSQTWFETSIDCSDISTLVNVLCLDSPSNVKAFNASIQNGTLKLMTFRSSDDYVRVVTLQYTKTS